MASPPLVTPRRPRGLNARLVMVGVALTLAWLGVGYRLVVVQGTRADEYAARGPGTSASTPRPWPPTGAPSSTPKGGSWP